MSTIQIILVVIVAFIVGCSSVNDQIETYQPVVAWSLIGLVTGQLELGVMLGGSLQLITMGWANVGAAMAPDASRLSEMFHPKTFLLYQSITAVRYICE